MSVLSAIPGRLALIVSDTSAYPTALWMRSSAALRRVCRQCFFLVIPGMLFSLLEA